MCINTNNSVGAVGHTNTLHSFSMIDIIDKKNIFFLNLEACTLYSQGKKSQDLFKMSILNMMPYFYWAVLLYEYQISIKRNLQPFDKNGWLVILSGL